LHKHPAIARVLHPAFEDCPGHVFWKRDFSGAGGLFSVTFASHLDYERVDALVDALKLFRIGFSWGGAHSLAVPYRLESARSEAPWTHGPLVRFYVGLEATDALIGDLDQAFKLLG
jgi:cystathionine beta-lyase